MSTKRVQKTSHSEKQRLYCIALRLLDLFSDKQLGEKFLFTLGIANIPVQGHPYCIHSIRTPFKKKKKMTLT